MTIFVHRIYASISTTKFKEYEIPTLLEHFRAANARREITGMLLYIAGYFFQALEGESAAVDELFDRILQDPRHTRISQIAYESIPERQFADRSMGFSTVDPLDAGALIGEKDFFREASCITCMDAGRARRLLLAFGSGRWSLEQPRSAHGNRRG